MVVKKSAPAGAVAPDRKPAQPDRKDNHQDDAADELGNDGQRGTADRDDLVEGSALIKGGKDTGGNRCGDQDEEGDASQFQRVAEPRQNKIAHGPVNAR